MTKAPARRPAPRSIVPRGDAYFFAYSVAPFVATT